MPRVASLVESLRCPYCGSSLETVATIPAATPAAAGSDAAYGILRCECAEFPVLDGIPILQHIDGLARVVQLLKEKDTVGALLRAMNVFRVTWAHRTRLHQAMYYRNCRTLAQTPTLTFEDALQLVRKPTVFADYLLHRYANLSFVSDVSLVPVLAGQLPSSARRPDGGAPRVLDIGCGAGHSTFLISSALPHVSVVASDQDFVSLYLAKRFLAPGAQFVCTDVEVPSPFADGYFDAVHCLDAFHYFRSKRAIVGELARALRPGGLFVFPHLHNALQENVTAGTPLSPEHYARTFGFLEPTLFDEADLVQHRLDVRAATRHSTQTAAQLRGAQTIAIVAGGNDPLGAAESLTTVLGKLGPTLRVNPIYQGRWDGDTLKLQLQWPNERLREECQAIESILPKTIDITRSEIASARSGRVPPDARTQDLLARFVLVPLPSNYSRRDLLAGRSDS